MAPNAIGSLLRRQSSSALHQSINLTQKRSWSARTIPTLSPTSSPDLDQTLNRFRDELFIPHALNVNQRNLIYRPRNASKLNGHPIIVPIGSNEESYQLRSINIFALPSRQDVVRVLSLMHETKDWSNLAIFLTGIYKSGMALTPERWEWLVRKAGGSNGLGQLLMCAQQSKSTQFQLRSNSLVERLFFELHLAGQRNDFTGTGVTKVHGLAKSFSLLMEAPEHTVHDLENDPKRNPLVIGTLLELSAARALSVEGTDQSREVESLARRLLASWKDQDLSTEKKDWPSIDRLLQQLVPSYNGLKLALQLDSIANNKHIASGLKTRVNEFGMFIAKLKKAAPKRVQEKPTIGLSQAQLLHQN
ncbi:hypothetical protein BJX76DRAFT_267673 [Aspergillus varians]